MQATDFAYIAILKKPNIHWKNIQEIVKNNFSSVVPMFLAFIPGLITMFGSMMVGIFLSQLNQYIIAAIYIVITMAVSGIYLLITKSIYTYDEDAMLRNIE